MNAKELKDLLDRFFFDQKGVSIVLSLYDGDSEVTLRCDGRYSYEASCGPLCIQAEEMYANHYEDHVEFLFRVEYNGWCGEMKIRYEDIDNAIIMHRDVDFTPEESE